MTPGIWYSTICNHCVHSWISKKGAFTNWNLVVGEGRLMRNCPLCKKYSWTYTYFIKYFRGPLLVTQKFATTPHPSVFCVSQHLHYCIFKLLNYFSHFSSLFIFFNSPFLQLFSHLCTPTLTGFCECSLRFQEQGLWDSTCTSSGLPKMKWKLKPWQSLSQGKHFVTSFYKFYLKILLHC